MPEKYHSLVSNKFLWSQKIGMFPSVYARGQHISTIKARPPFRCKRHSGTSCLEEKFLGVNTWVRKLVAQLLPIKNV